MTRPYSISLLVGIGRGTEIVRGLNKLSYGKSDEWMVVGKLGLIQLAIKFIFVTTHEGGRGGHSS